MRRYEGSRSFTLLLGLVVVGVGQFLLSMRVDPPLEDQQQAPSLSLCSQSNQEQKHESKVSPSQEIVWSWHHYNQKPTTNSSRILIAQATGTDVGYKKMLEITSVPVKAYARKYQHDYLSLVGLVLGGWEHWHATFGKVEALHMALEQRVYDAVLILDVDALIVDFDTDVASLVDDKYALLAQCVSFEPHAWNLNIGVALWNLRHNKTSWIAERWRNVSLETLASENPQEDQNTLHWILRDELSDVERNATVHTVNDTFQYRRGTFVKHFIRGHTNWTDNVHSRIAELQEISNKTCQSFKPSCEGISLDN